MNIADFEVKSKGTIRRSVRTVKVKPPMECLWPNKRLSLSKKNVAGVSKPTPFEDSTCKRPDNIINTGNTNETSENSLMFRKGMKNENRIPGTQTSIPPDENVACGYQTDFVLEKPIKVTNVLYHKDCDDLSKIEYGDTLPLEDQIFVDSELYVAKKPGLKTYKKKARINHSSNYLNIKTYGNAHKHVDSLEPDAPELLGPDSSEEDENVSENLSDLVVVQENSWYTGQGVNMLARDQGMEFFSEEDGNQGETSLDSEYEHDEEDEEGPPISPFEIVEMSNVVIENPPDVAMVDPLVINNEDGVNEEINFTEQITDHTLMSIKQEPLEDSYMLIQPATNEIPPHYLPGDLVWCRISSRSFFWPGIIMNDETSNCYFKPLGSKGKLLNMRCFHVYFYGDNGRRSWIYETNMLPYKGLEDLMTSNRKVPLNLLSRKVPEVPTIWEKAIAEADGEALLNPSERIASFEASFPSLFSINTALKSEHGHESIPSEATTTTEATTGRKRKRPSFDNDVTDRNTDPEEMNVTFSKKKKLINECLKIKLVMPKLNKKSTYMTCSSTKQNQSLTKKAGAKITRKYMKAKPISNNRENKSLTQINPKIVKKSNNNSKLNAVFIKSEVDMTEYTHLKQKNQLVKHEGRDTNTKNVASTSEECSTQIVKTSRLSLKHSELLEGLKSENENVCVICLQVSVRKLPVMCEGGCYQYFHNSCADMKKVNDIKTCKTCRNKSYLCYYCGKNIAPNEDMDQEAEEMEVEGGMHSGHLVLEKENEESKKNVAATLLKCKVKQCGKFYHKACLKKQPQVVIQGDGFICPMHTCHTCVCDNPQVSRNQINRERLVACVLCPTTYHAVDHCIPAGAKVLTTCQIICSKHNNNETNGLRKRINCTWCFVCCKGGELLCCESCPVTIHKQCAEVKGCTIETGFYCEDCQSGRFPLYGEVIWVKHGNYRWWPAIILLPSEIPDNMHTQDHTDGEFVVRFFGTNDYAWTHNQRSFPFHDGDEENKIHVKKSTIFNKFMIGVAEAAKAFNHFKEMKIKRDEILVPKAKPPPYLKIKVNKFTISPKALAVEQNDKEPPTCECKADNPCGDGCLNRSLMNECSSKCKAGPKCENQMFTKKLYPPMEVIATQECGWGLKTKTDLKPGQFVIEYVGEVIDAKEFHKRVESNRINSEINFYFLSISKNVYIDAGPKGNIARFMNHSCSPNCETQKWTVNGERRVGLFTTQHIKAGTELTFDYNLEILGPTKQPCFCKSENCSGFIGEKLKPLKSVNKGDKPKAKNSRKGKGKKVKKNKVAASETVKDKIETLPIDETDKRKESTSPSIPVSMTSNRIFHQPTTSNTAKICASLSKPGSSHHSTVSDNQDTSSSMDNTSTFVDTIQNKSLCINNSKTTQMQISSEKGIQAQPSTSKKHNFAEVLPICSSENVLPPKRRSSSKYRTSSTVAGSETTSSTLLKHDIPLVSDSKNLPSKRRSSSKYRSLGSNDETTPNKGMEEKSVACITPVIPAISSKPMVPSKPVSIHKRVTRKHNQKSTWMHDDACYSCEDGGVLVLCDQIQCPRAYHENCIPQNAKASLKSLNTNCFACPWHFCLNCNNKSDMRCYGCARAFCKRHNSLVVTKQFGYACKACSKESD